MQEQIMNDIQNNPLSEHFDPASPKFDLFRSPFYLIAHADFKFHEDLDKAIQKFGVDRTTYRLLTSLRRRNPLKHQGTVVSHHAQALNDQQSP